MCLYYSYDLYNLGMEILFKNYFCVIGGGDLEGFTGTLEVPLREYQN